MKYAIVCNLGGDFAAYQKELVLAIHEKFGIDSPFKQRFDPHFTIKYGFKNEDIEPIEKLIENFCLDHRSEPIGTGGFGSFRRDVIFINILLSDKARSIYDRFVCELSKFPDLEWRDYEGKNLNFHSTIAADCEAKFDEICNFLEGKERHFDCRLDIITILRECGFVDGVMTWETHKSFKMKN